MAIIAFIKGHVNRYKPDCFHLKNKQNLIIVFQNNKCSSDAQEEVSITCWMVATQCLLKLLLANKQTKMFKYQICISLRPLSVSFQFRASVKLARLISLKLELSDFHSTIHQEAPLALVANWATKWHNLHWSPGYQLVLSWYLHQPESHQLSLQKVSESLTH